MLGLALAAAATWAIAPGAASADDHRRDRGERFERRDRDDRYDRRDERRDRGDRWERERDRHHRGDRFDQRGPRGPKRAFSRDHDRRWKAPGHARKYASHDRKHDHWKHDRKHWKHDRKHWKHDRKHWKHDRRDWRHRPVAKARPRFHRHARVPGSWPYYCSEHRHGFRYRSHFDDHLVRFHHLPHWYLPRLVAHIGFGWTFGY
jgi:hypothetical protein